jgi:signal transduction histidine kinase
MPQDAPPEPPPQPATQREVLALFLASHGASTLRVIVWLWLTGVVLVSAQNYLMARVPPTIATWGGGAVFLAVLLLLRAQRLRAAIATFMWGTLSVVFVSAPLVAGLQTPALIVLPMLAMLASWLLGGRQSVAMLALMVIYLFVLTWAQEAGRLPSPMPRSATTWALAYLVACAVAALFGVVMVRAVRQYLTQAHALADELREANLHLEDKVAARTAELSAALERLKQTQNDLIQSEKLASLGSLVAGVAHELNTPISNALLTAEVLKQRADALDQAAQQGNLRKSQLISDLGGVRDMSALINRSVERAAALVASFKQVAASQVSERRAQFDLRTVVEEQLAVLRPGAAAKGLVLDNQVPEGLSCESFPAPFGQVLVNLVQNAVLHGFAGRAQGCVSVSARLDGAALEWCVADDGVGMDTATATHIFEPFFTTRLGQGGSGLGLAICYRIVTTILAGDIRVVTSPGTGSQFIVRMPRRTPGAI